MTAAVAGPSSVMGPYLPGGVSEESKGHSRSVKKEKRAGKHHRREHDEDGGESDSSASSSTNASLRARNDGKKEKRSRKSGERRNSDTSFTTATSDGEEGDDVLGGGVTQLGGKDIRKWKGKGPAASAFLEMHPTIDIPIPPALCQDPLLAARELMDTLLMRYVPQLGGVLLRHEDIAFTRQAGLIDGDGAFATAPATMSLHVWAPKVGMRVEGTVILSTPSHVSLLVHDKFNASITSAHLPSVQEMAHMPKEAGYEWHEFEAEQLDEEMNEAEAEAGEGEGIEENAAARMDGTEVGEKSTGYWVNAKTGERLGGQHGKVTFTVVALTIANNMLSVHGSLLRKPFSIPAPTYIPSALLSTVSAQTATAPQEVSRRVRFQDGHQTSEYDPYQENEEDDSDDDQDDDRSSLIAANVVQPIDVAETKENGKPKKKKRSSEKIGPRREGETSGSESEGDGKREKKKRKKEE